MKKFWICCAFSGAALIGCTESECRVGERVCVDNVSKTCQNGAWLEVICENTAPVCDEKRGCIPIPQTCGNGIVEGNEECDGKALREKTCDDMFEGLIGTLACSADCEFDTTGCHAPGCEDGQVLCAGNKLQKCSGGQWNEQDCGDLVCDAALKKCTARLCTDGTRRCTGQKLEICIDNQWHHVIDCAEGGLKCDSEKAACVQNICSEGELRCDEKDGISAVAECRRNTWVAVPCADGTVCTKNIETGSFACAEQTCVEGTSCDGSRLITCKYNLIIASRDCAREGMKCIENACK